MSQNEQIRAGILLTLQQNLPLAILLHFGYLPYNRDGARAGYGRKAHSQIRVALVQLNRKFVDLGGSAADLKRTVWAGVGLSGIGQLSGRMASSGSSSGVPTLDLINAVAGLFTAIINALNKAKPNDPNDPVPDEYLPDDEEEEAS